MHSFNYVAQNTNQENTTQSPQNASSQGIPSSSASSGSAVTSDPVGSSSPSPKSGGHNLIIIGVVALVIIAVIAYSAYSRLSISQPISTSTSSAASTSSATSTATGYAKIATALSAGKTVTLSQLASVAGFNITQGISKSISGSSNYNRIFGNDTNVSYSVSGKVSASISGIILSFPFSYLIGSDTNGNYSVINAKGKILSSNLSYIIVNTPSSSFICSNQSQSQNLLLSLLDSSVSGNTQPPPSDNKCVAKEMPKKETNQTIIASYAAIANNIANNVSLNASNVSYVSYRGNSCIYLKGYITSNKIKISQVPSASNTSSQPYFVKFSGPYSTCISTTTGLPYNFTTTMALNLTSPPSTSTTSTASSFTISSLNVSFSVASNMTYYGKAESTQELSALPYPIINGTCPSGMTISTINGTSQYFMCQNVNMNSSGYVMMELSPSKNPNLFGVQQSNQTEKIRILGLYCEETNSSSASIFMPEPNTTLFTPVNISSMSNQSLSITTRCSSTSLGTQYNGTVYAVVVTKSIFKPNTTVNTSLSIGTFSVLPTLTGAVGSNPNNGPVSKSVIVTNPFSSGPTIISTNSTPAYNSVG